MRFGRNRQWPEPSHQQVVKRARILVIDDMEFPYQKLFKADGYSVDKWNDVRDLGKLEDSTYDLVLLDLLGVGRAQSSDQGFGLLKHIRSTNPAQLVIAYSNADWPVRYQSFFEMADAVLPKTADYVEFKRTVDELLARRFSLGFYLDRTYYELADHIADVPKALEKAQKAILTGKTTNLRQYLMRRIGDEVTVDRALSVVQIAIMIAQLWKS